MSVVLHRFWAERTERERVVIAFVMTLVAFALAYAYVWLPVTRERNRLLVRVPELRAEAQGMERAIREGERLKTAARPTVKLKAVIEQAAAARGIALSLSVVAPQGTERMRIRITAVRASDWFSWVAQLHSSHNVRLASAQIVSLEDSDRLSVEAIFTKGR